MDYSTVRNLIKSSPAIRILRKEYAPLIICFLYSRFKSRERLEIKNSDIQIDLEDYIDYLKENKLITEDMNKTAEAHLKEWADETEGGFIRKFYKQGSEEAFVELTPEAEKVFLWFGDLLKFEKREVIGTETRFFSVFTKLQKILDESVSDKETKILQLEEKKKEIELEIERLKEGGDVKTFSKDRVLNEYEYARKEAMELVSEFKQVEKNFAEITRNLQQKFLEVYSTKGSVLEYVLNADEELMNSPQGKSFRAFWEFLNSEAEQDKMESTIESIYSMDDLILVDEGRFFRHFKKILLDCGGRVNKATVFMTEQIRKTLAEKAVQENRRVKELISEIKSLAMKHPEDVSKFHYIQNFLDIKLIMDRPLWKPERVHLDREFGGLEGEEGEFDLSQLLSMAKGLNIDDLKKKVEELLRYKPSVALIEVLESTKGSRTLEELVAYLWIAASGEKHQISETEYIKVPIVFKGGEEFLVKIPSVVYSI